MVNSDPKVICIFLAWLQKIYGIPKINFKLKIHIYPDCDEQESIVYWSCLTGIPRSQFRKTQVDRRTNKSIKKHKKLPYGTAHVQVNSCGNPNFGVQLHHRIMGSIDVFCKNFGMIIK